MTKYEKRVNQTGRIYSLLAVYLIRNEIPTSHFYSKVRVQVRVAIVSSDFI